MNTSIILDWPAAALAGAPVAGGKGWQLARLAELGVAVPSGFIIAAEASRDHRPGTPLPAELVVALAQALTERDWEQRPLAVRSSAPQEDSARTSFAGIHASQLNVLGLDAVVSAVQTVWESRWTSQAHAYRRRHGIDDADATMAVIVMPLLPAVASGIAFTLDPLSGRDDQLLIHAHWGLGESLVGGQAEGDEYRVQQHELDDRLTLLEQRLGSKTRLSCPAIGGGTELIATDPGQVKQLVLSPEQALALAALARDAAEALDYGQPGFDLEWVWDGERFWIVQARPVTARARHGYPALFGQPALWSRGNTREILPEPLSPLDWGLSRLMVGRMLTLGYALSGYRPLSGAQRAGLFHGRLYLQTSLMQWEGYDAFGVPPAAMNQLLGGSQGEITVPPATLRQRWARGQRMLRYLARSGGYRRQAMAELAAAHRRASVWLTEPLPADDAGLARLLRRQFAAVREADALFFLQGSAGGTLYKLVELIDKYCPGEGHALAAALLAGGEPSVTTAQSHQLLALAQLAEQEPLALAWLRSPERVGRQWNRALPNTSPFRRELGRFLVEHGHRGVYETYLRNPSWNEDPDYLLDTILGLIGSDVEALRRHRQQANQAARQRLGRKLPLWLRPLIRHLATVAARESRQREAARSVLVAHLAVLRRGVLELGRRHTHSAGLTTAEASFDLTFVELLALAEGRLAPAAAGRRATVRLQQRDRWAQQQEPDVIVETDGAAQSVPPARPIVASGSQWQGTAVGSGDASGPAHLARHPHDGLDMATGAVLVAPTTDPAWTPLFLKAGALVMESGGYLSHGAIVAREFGIPAVTNLPGILAQLHHGERLLVDGSQGTVRRETA